jgi:hypothetical protein
MCGRTTIKSMKSVSGTITINAEKEPARITKGITMIGFGVL